MAKQRETYLSRYDVITSNDNDVLGEGGNAKVFLVEDKKSHERFALKSLQQRSKEKIARFQEEIDIMVNNRGIEGVMPIIDYDKENLWYTMHIAEPVLNHIKKVDIEYDKHKSKLNRDKDTEKPIFSIIADFISLVDTFKKLHLKGIYHRDIKPANIYFLNDRYYIGDFGLVDFPDNTHDFTRSDKGVGAIFTIAPEMKRNPKEVKNPGKSDVYSLAKTLWMLLTLDDKGFDGQYSYTNPKYALRLNPRYKDTHLAEIEELLVDSTNDEPEMRPTIDEFQQRLKEWQTIVSDKKHITSAISDWNFLNKLIFKGQEAESSTWRDPQRIVEILNLLCLLPTDNHTIFSERGGLDLTSAEMAGEQGCICLHFGSYLYIVKAKSLHYETFSDDPSWNYMILEAEPLKPIFDFNDSSTEIEELVEDTPGHYIKPDYFVYGVYDYDSGKPLPETARRINRIFKGELLILLKTSFYNSLAETYDGRHGQCSPSQFREYIGHIKDEVSNPKSTRNDIHKAIGKLYKPLDADVVEAVLNQQPSKPEAPLDFVENNYKAWNFFDCLPQNSDDVSKTKLLFNIRVGIGSSFSSLLDNLSGNSKYLLEDGSMGIPSQSNPPYLFTSRKDVVATYKSIYNKIRSYYELAGFASHSHITDFNMEFDLIQNQKPTHLFTKEEIRELMRNADDRHNNKLVIDEDGFARLIQDLNLGSLYPVSRGMWIAGNNYVGRYSPLTTVDSAYLDSLARWLDYLKTGEHQTSDYDKHVENVNELISEIMKYY